MVVEIHGDGPKGKWIFGIVVEPNGRVSRVPPPLARFKDADWRDLKRFVEGRGWGWYPIIASQRAKDEAIKLFPRIETL